MVKVVGDKRRGIYYYLTLLCVVLLAVFFEHSIGSFSLIGFVSVFVHGVVLVVVVLFLVSLFIREVVRDRKKFNSIDLIVETVRQSVVPGLLFGLLFFVLNLVSGFVGFFLGFVVLLLVFFAIIFSANLLPHSFEIYVVLKI